MNDEMNFFNLCIQCEKLANGGKNNFSNKNKVLFLLKFNGEMTPSELMENINIEKPNLTALCKSLIASKLIESAQGSLDKRTVSYIITSDGEREINSFMSQFNFPLCDRSSKAFDKRAKDIIKVLKKVNIC